MNAIPSTALSLALGALVALAAPAAAQLSGVIDLADVGGAVPGVTFSGINFGDFSGASVSSAGDVNGDGLADLLIGAYGADPGGVSDAGETYLVFGSASLAGRFDLAAADVTFSGIDARDGSGFSVSSAGDVNGDGLADLLIGAPGVGPGGNPSPGEVYLVYGSASLAGSVDLAAAGVTFSGIDGGDGSGVSVSSAGDVNGDGLADLLIGAPNAGGGDSIAGETYLVYGSTNLASNIDLAAADVTFSGIDEGDYSGVSVASAGDVNGDGLADLLIGTYGANSDAGETYLVYGRASLAGSIDLADIGGAVPGVTFRGIDAEERSRISVSSAGDVNGDGLADFLIGAYGADLGGGTPAGETYLIYGQAGPIPEPTGLALASLAAVVAVAARSRAPKGPPATSRPARNLKRRSTV